MRRPSLFFWLNRWAIGAAVCLFLLAVGLAVVNAIDYAPFGLALRRANKLNVADLENLAAACARYEKNGQQRFSADSIPADFRALKPVHVSIFPRSSDITLLKNGDDRYVFLRVSTSPENQSITLVSYCGQPQRRQLLWEKNPELTRRLNPGGRILTISQSDMYSSRDWIVLPSRLLIVDRRYTVGKGDQIVADMPLNTEQSDLIESAILGLGPELRGHVFDAGAFDGINLWLSFSSDGESNRSTDIVLSNVWLGDLESLVQTISKIAGKDHAISFQETVKRMDALGGRPPIILSLAEYERRRDGSRPTPWWCWWPMWTDSENG